MADREMDSLSHSTADTPTDSSGRSTAACWNIIDGAVNMPVLLFTTRERQSGVNRCKQKCPDEKRLVITQELGRRHQNNLY